MKKILLLLSCVGLVFLSASGARAENDISKHPSCDICGMDRRVHDHSRMVLEYDDKTSAGTCSIHCTAAQMAAHREKTIISMLVADHAAKDLIDAKKAIWVIGGNQAGVMTGRAKWAFREKEAAARFIKDNGGTLGTYHDAMKAAFADMRDDIHMLHKKTGVEQAGLADIQSHPSCRYCGMDRRMYDYSRMLVEYADGASEATCSIHCTAIDLALNPSKAPKSVMVGDYHTRQLIDAQRAWWVIGGDRYGVMSIRGKWAFAEKTHAEDYIKEHGGNLRGFNDALQAAFEDMWEILR
jgi:nitrous oxide reductase accessory protein NosL